jgi:hypothetical protein
MRILARPDGASAAAQFVAHACSTTRCRGVPDDNCGRGVMIGLLTGVHAKQLRPADPDLLPDAKNTSSDEPRPILV